jgi:rhodanese-related sulfurtransferase
MFVRNSLIIALVLAFALSLSASCLAAKTSSDFVKEAKKTVEEISVADAKADIDAGKVAVILDCRTEKEFKRGHLPNAMHIPRGLLEFQADKKIPNKNSYIICYCKTGGRSCLSTRTLTQMGYTNIKSMAGGWKAWLKAGYPIEE